MWAPRAPGAVGAAHLQHLDVNELRNDGKQVAKLLDGGDVVLIRELHRHFCDRYPQSAGADEDLDVEEESVGVDLLKYSGGRVSREALEAALRVPRSQPEHQADERVERAATAMASVNVPDQRILHHVHRLRQAAIADLQSAFYFSAVTYTTTGYGDVVLPPEWRVVGGIEALTGILMCGWSTALLFAVMTRIHAGPAAA